MLRSNSTKATMNMKNEATVKKNKILMKTKESTEYETVACNHRIAFFAEIGRENIQFARKHQESVQC